MARPQCPKIDEFERTDGTTVYTMRLMVDGERRTIQLGDERKGATRRGAKAKRKDVLEDIRLGRWKPDDEKPASVAAQRRSEPGVAEAADLFLDFKLSRRLRQSTIDRLEWIIKTHLVPFYKNVKPSRITQDDVIPLNVGTTYMSTAHLLHAYRFPEVLKTARDGFTADHLLDGAASTLYLTSSSRHQKMLAPILVALVSSVIDAAIEKSRAAGSPLDPRLRVLLDEVANCAPLGSLPGHLSDVAAYGVRIATVWQSVAQMRDRYGDAKDTIMGASTDKLFLGPITDKTTRDEVVDLLGRHQVDVGDHPTLAEKATAQGLQQLTWGRALVVSGALPPAVVQFRPHWSNARGSDCEGSGNPG